MIQHGTRVLLCLLVAATAWLPGLAVMKLDSGLEVFVSTPLEECARRDVKGLYAKALAGEIKNFTGVSDSYEPPLNPELTLETVNQAPQQSAQLVIEALEVHGFLPRLAAAARS